MFLKKVKTSVIYKKIRKFLKNYRHTKDTLFGNWANVAYREIIVFIVSFWAIPSSVQRLLLGSGVSLPRILLNQESLLVGYWRLNLCQLHTRQKLKQLYNGNKYLEPYTCEECTPCCKSISPILRPYLLKKAILFNYYSFFNQLLKVHVLRTFHV